MARILVIEDAALIREHTSEVLEFEGFTVFQAENGRVGLKLAQELLPDLMICDIMMPELDGYGVLTALRMQPDTAAIPFIFLTAKADHESLRAGMASGADDYLTKPFTSAELLQAVRARLDKQATLKHSYEQTVEDLRGNLMQILPHELYTPLTAIMGNAAMLQMDLDRLDKIEIGAMAALITKASQRLQRVMNNYLMYAQIEIFKHDPPALARISRQHYEAPGTLIQDVATKGAWNAGRIADLALQTEDVDIRISPESLQKMIEELVDNALKFSEAGTPIAVQAETRDTVYRVSIHDRGRGMTPEEISRVGAYMQFERKLYEQQGLGLGLIIAKSLVELHGGRFSIQSAVGKGTTVVVELLKGSAAPAC